MKTTMLMMFAVILLGPGVQEAEAVENLRHRFDAARSSNKGSVNHRNYRTASADSAYRIEKIPLPPDAFAGLALDINNRGTVAGMFFKASGDRTFVWDKNGLREISKPEEPITAVASIAHTGALFGNWGSIAEQTAGFYLPQQDRWIPLPSIPGKPMNIGQRANNAGVATGMACEGDWFQPLNCTFWIWNGKSYEFPELPSSPALFLDGINERGQAVGRYLVTPPFGFRSFVLSGEKLDIVLPDTNSAAYDINNRGDIVLNFEIDPTILFVPAVLQGGKLDLLPMFPGAFGTTYIGLNDRGDFVGLAYDDLQSPYYPVVLLSK